MFKLFFKICVLFLLLTAASFSKNYSKIVIDGNKRISDQSIILFSEIPNDNIIDESILNLILKNLFNTGFFEDVNVKFFDSVLIINVIENPIIETLFIEGVKTKKLNKLIKSAIILKDRSSFNTENIKKDKLSIINILKQRGYYLPQIEVSIQKLDDNKINLTYLIDAGKKAKISKISFVGNKKFKDSKLKSIILSEEHKFWKIITNKKFLNEELIAIDNRLLNSFYKNKGYYNVKIESSFANYLGENEFELIFNIDSDIRYFFNNFEIDLPPDYDIDNFKSLIDTFSKLKGEYYSLNRIEDILKEIDKISLTKQYEFLSSTVNQTINDNLIDFKFNIIELEKLYIERINIFGNNITNEEVIRNSLISDEGDAFNSLLHNKSINNLKSLNFFREVNSEIIDGSTNIQKIINISVEEKATGEISAGAGVGTNGGSVGFSVKENNFLGKGILLGSDLTMSGESVKGLFSLNNPNYKGTNKSINFSAESSVLDRLTNYGYKSSKTGFSVGTGFEIYDDLFFNAGISSYIEEIKTDSTASASIKKQKGSFFDTFFNYTLDYDLRNQKFKPTDGFRSRFTQNVPMLSDTYTLKNTYDYKIYNEWLNENIASFGFYASAVNSLSGKNVKLSDRVFVPASKLRGFESGKVGPKDGADYVGGNYSMSFNASTTLPQILPNLQNTNFSIFFDAANVWGVDYFQGDDEGSDIRSSVGVVVDFFTPIGPLNFSFSEVLTKNKNDISESFRFNLGTTF